MSLLFLKRSATTNSTSVINNKTKSSSSATSVSVQNLVSLARNHQRYSFLTTPDLTGHLTSSINDLNDLNSKREREKVNVLKEVISSEKKYLNDLKEIVDGYYDEIARFKPDNHEFIYHIFSNIKDIYEFTKIFYSMLDKTDLDEISIASCFIKKHKSFLTLYSTYCQNYKIAYLTSEKLEKDPQIGKIIERVRIKFGHCLKMATYLQLPVLRITKYHLLLQRYLKLLDQDSFAHSQIQEALDLMKQVNDQINKEMSTDQSIDSELVESLTSNFNMLKLVGLFGSILKQGNLILNETKTYHHVIVFQNMLLIRKSDLYLSKVICTISNENLGFSPISSSKQCNKSFTVIDYSPTRSIDNSDFCQFILKTRTVDEKKAWQACILQCILNGYGKKLSDNVKKRVLKIDSHKIVSKYDSIRMKLSSFKRIKDLRNTIKHDIKRSNSQEFKTKKIEAETQQANNNNNNNKRRLSEHFQSSIKRLLDKKPEKSEGVQSLLKSFRKEKIQNLIFSNNKFKSNCSILNESNEMNKSQIQNESQIEMKLDFNESNLNTSSCSYTIEKMDQSTILKFENILNQNLKNNEFEFCYCDSAQSFDSLIERQQQQIKQTDELLSSKSSINSEEGYYSNHDSSSTVSTLVNEPLELFKQKDMEIDNTPIFEQRFSIYNDKSMFDCKLNMPVNYSRFSYNCYSNEDNYSISDENHCDSPQSEIFPTVNELKNKLTRNKFSSLGSLKQDINKQPSFQNLSKSNSYVSEIKLFFDRNVRDKSNHHNNFNIQNEYKTEISSESESFRINIKDLISKFEKNKQ